MVQNQTVDMVKIRKEAVFYAKYPIIETKRSLTQEERKTMAVLMSAEEEDWHRYIEDYPYFVTKAEKVFAS